MGRRGIFNISAFVESLRKREAGTRARGGVTPRRTHTREWQERGESEAGRQSCRQVRCVVFSFFLPGAEKIAIKVPRCPLSVLLQPTLVGRRFVHFCPAASNQDRRTTAVVISALQYANAHGGGMVASTRQESLPDSNAMHN